MINNLADWDKLLKFSAQEKPTWAPGCQAGTMIAINHEWSLIP